MAEFAGGGWGADRVWGGLRRATRIGPPLETQKHPYWIPSYKYDLLTEATGYKKAAHMGTQNTHVGPPSGGLWRKVLKIDSGGKNFIDDLAGGGPTEASEGTFRKN